MGRRDSSAALSLAKQRGKPEGKKPQLILFWTTPSARGWSSNEDLADKRTLRGISWSFLHNPAQPVLI